MKRFISIFMCILIVFMITSANASAEDELPLPDWVTITLNKDSTKNVSVNTPVYLTDYVASYQYSTDGGDTWITINNSTGGDIVVTESCVFMLSYICTDGRSSETYSVEIKITKNTVVTDGSTGISLIIPKDSPTPTDIKLSCYEIIKGVDYSAAAAKFGKNKPFLLFNVTLMYNNTVYESTHENKFMFPTENLDNRYCKLYYINSDGSTTLIETTNEVSVLYADIVHNGIYAVVQDMTYAKGDINGDSKINAADARLALRASAKLEVLSAMERDAADVDNNGKVNAADAKIILTAAAGLTKIP